MAPCSVYSTNSLSLAFSRSGIAKCFAQRSHRHPTALLCAGERSTATPCPDLEDSREGRQKALFKTLQTDCSAAVAISCEVAPSKQAGNSPAATIVHGHLDATFSDATESDRNQAAQSSIDKAGRKFQPPFTGRERPEEAWHLARLQRQRLLHKRAELKRWPEPEQPPLGVRHPAFIGCKACACCTRTWPLRFFPKKPTSKDGHLELCYGCRAEQLMAVKPFRELNEISTSDSSRPESPPTIIPQTCRQCGFRLPASFFPIRVANMNGRDRSCQACWSGWYQQRPNAPKVQAATKHCSHCNQNKPKADFSRQAAATDGLQSRCKECNRAIKARTESLWHFPVQSKTCNRCTQTKLTSDFSPDARCHDGRQGICRQCRRGGTSKARMKANTSRRRQELQSC